MLIWEQSTRVSGRLQSSLCLVWPNPTKLPASKENRRPQTHTANRRSYRDRSRYKNCNWWNIHVHRRPSVDIHFDDDADAVEDINNKWGYNMSFCIRPINIGRSGWVWLELFLERDFDARKEDEEWRERLWNRVAKSIRTIWRTIIIVANWFGWRYLFILNSNRFVDDYLVIQRS